MRNTKTKITINLVKSVVYRIMMYLFDSILVLLLTGNLLLAFTSGIVLEFIQIGLYFLFETVWEEFVIDNNN